MSADAQDSPRAIERPRARCVSSRRLGADAPIRRRRSRSTSPSSAPAPAAARWPASLPNTASRSWRSTPDLIGGRSRILPPTSTIRPSSTGPTSASSTARIRCSSAPTIPANRSAARPCISPWCRCASGPNGSRRASKLGYGADWPLDWREMWTYYAEVEKALKISGPVNYPWGPKRPRYPYRPHELNAAALVLAEGAEALGIGWTPTPLATVSAPRGHSPPCVYRGMCVIGCSTNAKQSVLITWLPRALAAGAEIRDLAMVGPHRARRRWPRHRRALSCAKGRWRFQRARNVVVAGYAIETPRLAAQFRDEPVSRRPRQFFRAGRQESDGAVQPGGVGPHGAGNPLLQRAAVARHHRALELHRQGQGFLRRLRLHEPGPAAGRLVRHASRQSAVCGASACSTRWRNTTIRSGSRSSANACRRSATA